MVRCFPCERRGFVRHRLRTRGGRRGRGAIEEGRAMLSEIYCWFTEGFDIRLEGREGAARRAKRVAVVSDSLHRHDSTAREMTSLLAHRGSIMLDFAPCEKSPSNV